MFFLISGLFLIAIGVCSIVFGEPTTGTLNIDIPPNEKPTMEYNTHIWIGWGLIIIGLVPLLISSLIYLDHDTEQQAHHA